MFKLLYVDTSGEFHEDGDICYINHSGEDIDVGVVMSLDEVDAVLAFIGDFYPNGWEIIDGKVVEVGHA